MDEDQAPSQIVPGSIPKRTIGDRFRSAKRTFTTREGLVGTYDYAFLFRPNLPFMKRVRQSAPFFGLNDKMPILLAMLLGLQHAIAMLAGVVTPPMLMSGAAGANLPLADQQYLVSTGLIVAGTLSMVQITRFHIYKTQYYIGTGQICPPREDMGRAGATTPSTSKRKEKEGSGAVSAEDKAEQAESKRLRDLAFSRSLLSRTRSHALQPSFPSKTILNSDGRDIVKKGHRKSKYLFAFPGLMAPVAGGKLGELTNLDSKNPVLYVEFPQGRLKLFGTIVYPKNKYLTLHFPRGAGNIVCEDCFESVIVFSHAWWIGTKEHNPEEARLPLPRSLEQDKHADVDFTAGAGQAKDYNNTTCHQLEKFEAVAQFDLKPKPDVSEAESSGKDTEDQIMSQPVRQSARTAGRTLKYADSSDKEDDSDSVESQQILNTRGKKQLQAPKEVSNNVDMNIGECSGATTTIIVVSDCDSDTPIKTAGAGRYEKKSPSDVKIPTMTDLRNITGAPKTSLKASNSKTSVLKQSRLEAFCHPDPSPEERHTTTVKDAPLMELKHEVTTSGVKSAKRPRKASKEDSEVSRLDDEDDSSGLKDTPSKDRKRAKCEKGAGLKASTPTASHSKASNGGRTKQVKSSKEKKSATANVSKGVGSASKGKKPASKPTKSSKRSFDTEEEISDPDGVNDDSDEDWLG